MNRAARRQQARAGGVVTVPAGARVKHLAVTDYRAAVAALRDRNLGQVAGDGGITPLNHTDPPRHTALRRALAAAGVAALIGLDDVIGAVIAARVARLRDRDPVDLVAEYARPVAGDALAAYVGVAEEDAPGFAAALDTIAAVQRRERAGGDAEAALSRLGIMVWNAYTGDGRGLAPSLRTRSTLDAPDALEQLAAVAIIGYGALADTLGLTLHALMQMPGGLPAWVTLPDRALDELLRHHGAAVTVSRVALAPTVIGPARVQAGEVVAVHLDAANRDPRVFPRPGAFCPGRENTGDHLAFGHGVHTCLGEPLARLTLRAAIESLAVAGELRVMGPVRIERAAAGRRLAALPVAWGTR